MAKSDRLRLLCLLDAVGAAASTLGMLVILLLPQGLTGVPKLAAALFAGAVASLAVNSFRTWRTQPQIKGRAVVLIGLLNLAYCAAAAAFAVAFSQTLQPLVLAYFAVELVIVVPLAVFEILSGRAALNQEN